MQLILSLLSSMVVMAAAYPQPQATPGCTYTSIEFPHFDMSPTSTVYQSTVVATQTVDCGGCTSIAVETQKLGVGPERQIEAVVTVAETTTTAYQCQATNSE